MEKSLIEIFSHGGTDTRGPIFIYSAAWMRLNLNDDVGYVDLKGIGRLQLMDIDQRLLETSQEKG